METTSSEPLFIGEERPRRIPVARICLAMVAILVLAGGLVTLFQSVKYVVESASGADDRERLYHVLICTRQASNAHRRDVVYRSASDPGFSWRHAGSRHCIQMIGGDEQPLVSFFYQDPERDVESDVFAVAIKHSESEADSDLDRAFLMICRNPHVLRAFPKNGAVFDTECVEILEEIFRNVPGSKDMEVNVAINSRDTKLYPKPYRTTLGEFAAMIAAQRARSEDCDN